MAPRKTTTAAAGGDATPEPPAFEPALERLETIVDELEGGELTLEESLTRYEEGIKLSRRLTQQLDEAEKRIERLVESPEGSPRTEPFVPSGGGDDESSEGELPF